MLFKNEEASLKLDIVNYEFPADGGDPDSDDLPSSPIRVSKEPPLWSSPV